MARDVLGVASMPFFVSRAARLLPLVALAACAGPYSLIHPTPREAMREMATDRPDMTESPLSVEPGHVQVEFDTVAYESSRTATTHTHETRAATVNTRLGIGMRTDLQLVVVPLVHRVTTTANSAQTEEVGFGDTTLRLKINLRGNEEEGFAIGLLPFVVAPTSTGDIGDDQLSGGIAAPMSISLSERLDLGMMVQLDLGAAEEGGVAIRTLGTLTLGVAVVGPFAVFFEVAQATELEDGDVTPTFEVHGGMTYELTPNLRLDAGLFATAIGEGHPILAFLGGTYRH